MAAGGRTKAEGSTKTGYARAWRWHFYAALFTAPFLLILSITGAIYLFDDELNDWLHPQLRFASAGDTVLPAGDLVAAVRSAYPDAVVTRIDMPVAPGRSAMAFVTPEQGEPLRVFVDPASAEVLGDFVYQHTLVGFADVMHGSLLLGTGGDALVELAASWALILVITGLYLWWPGNSRLPQRRRVRRADGAVRRRRRWREVHRWVGSVSALMVVFLIVTGLPWASFWGERVLSPISNALALGYPPELRHHGSGTPTDKTLMDTLGDAPWALQQAPLPDGRLGHDVAPYDHAQHDTAHHHPAHPGVREPDVSTDAINRVHGLLAGQGLAGYRLSIPAAAGDPYSAYTYPARPQGQRTVHVDGGGHKVLVNVGFDDYGAIAKAVEYGVALHMGNYFGRANQIVMLLTCVAIVALVITGLVMWWRRRPAGGFGAPAGPPLRARTLVAVTATLLLLLPLAGASLLLMLALDALWRRLPRRH